MGNVINKIKRFMIRKKTLKESLLTPEQIEERVMGICIECQENKMIETVDSAFYSTKSDLEYSPPSFYIKHKNPPPFENGDKEYK